MSPRKTACFSQSDDVFLWIDDREQPKQFAYRLASVSGPSVLNRYARKINTITGSSLPIAAQCFVLSRGRHIVRSIS